MFSFFFFNDTATTEIYTLSLHDALPIFPYTRLVNNGDGVIAPQAGPGLGGLAAEQINASQLPTTKTLDLRVTKRFQMRSEEHTSELQSRLHLVCRLLLEKKKKHRH